MSEYKSIKGKTVQFLGTDPSETSTEGQVWYNSAAGAFKSLLALEAWSSGSPMISPQRDGGYGQSTPSTASWAAGGTSSTRNIVTTQEYNGSGWSSGGNLNTGREEGTGFGLVSASVLAGGATYPPALLKNEVEEYDGSTWTAGTALPASRKKAAGAGTQTTGLISFGSVDPPSTTGSINATTLEYDGTSWTAGGTGNTARYQISGCGTQTAALAFGGNDPSYSGATEEYDGSTWTTSGAMNTARSLMGGSGIQTSALAYAGFTPYSVKTENYNGTSWSNSPDLSTARDRVQGGGTDSSNAIAAGGLIGTSPYTVNLTEEFNKSVNVITAAAWSSGANYPYAAANVVSLGPATAMLGCGGNDSGPTLQTTVTLYDGTSYSAETGMPSAGNGMGQGKGGTETAGLVFGGNFADDPATATKTILYDGSAWTSGGALSTGRRNLGGLGISTAALAFGGQTPAYTTATEEYGGSSWTSGGALPEGRRNATGVGSQTAGLVLAGQSPPNAGINTSFTYNGTSYSLGPTMLNNRSDAAASGPNSSDTSALVYGGSSGSPAYTVVLATETYDGSAFSTSPSLSTGRDGHGSGASVTEGVQVAGYVPGAGSYPTSTEQFTGETSALNLKTLTTS